jgi:uncharacterized damage-inducible protein DinB
MQVKDAIKHALVSSQNLLKWYVSDLSDADLLVRPVPDANHIAWQLGHLVVAERNHITSIAPGANFPDLPAGFAEQHKKATAALEPPTGFSIKDEYLRLIKQGREATLAALDGMSEADLDKPTPGEIGKFAPTYGALFLLDANHTLMHAGQFTVVRRKLGKPVLF